MYPCFQPKPDVCFKSKRSTTDKDQDQAFLCRLTFLVNKSFQQKFKALLPMFNLLMKRSLECRVTTSHSCGSHMQIVGLVDSEAAVINYLRRKKINKIRWFRKAGFICVARSSISLPRHYNFVDFCFCRFCCCCIKIQKIIYWQWHAAAAASGYRVVVVCLAWKFNASAMSHLRLSEDTAVVAVRVTHWAVRSVVVVSRPDFISKACACLHRKCGWHSADADKMVTEWVSRHDQR